MKICIFFFLDKWQNILHTGLYLSPFISHSVLEIFSYQCINNLLLLVCRCTVYFYIDDYSLLNHEHWIFAHILF